jgi:hypothetical protein
MNKLDYVTIDKISLTSATVRLVHDTLEGRYSVDLDRGQIEYYAKKNKRLWKDLLQGDFTSGQAADLMDEIVRDVMGSGKRWNKNDDRFLAEWIEAARRNGIRLIL